MTLQLPKRVRTFKQMRYTLLSLTDYPTSVAIGLYTHVDIYDPVRCIHFEQTDRWVGQPMIKQAWNTVLLLVCSDCCSGSERALNEYWGAKPQDMSSL